MNRDKPILLTIILRNTALEIITGSELPQGWGGKIPGLYLASGSAHPGGGLFLCALSGMIAARCALIDLKK